MHNTVRRIMFYFFGIIILTFGIALTIQSKLGTSPFDALLVGLFRTFGLTIGSWEIIVGMTMILCNAFAERRRPEYFAVITSLLTGFSIDAWLFAIGDWATPESMLTQTICLGLGIVASALGIAINLQADFAPNPFDRSMLVLKRLTGWNVSVSRAVISIVLVILAAIFSGPIGIGTVLITFISGTLIHLFMPHVSQVDQFLSKQVKYTKKHA
ncbi:YczE/YyaS/YitT family protein [Halobacillus amylolyticus]|uniref:YitT family protein n=1 Tax=Halobacillus amylolyticus TaxID=2932259 RepID=A0ABY4HCP2_9BACI|nr:YitT family protein [Halobacillus amylolyticus]UOR12379.1 YitT family protein [Halobacillus amylolyticus]